MQKELKYHFHMSVFMQARQQNLFLLLKIRKNKIANYFYSAKRNSTLKASAGLALKIW
jgi:hypothetical protein